MTEKNATFRRDLQGLRAIAILLVIFAHANLSVAPGGFIGVDVFFVLSGFLITDILLRELEKNGRIAFARFYARRLKRLLPALIFMLSISFGIALWLLSGVEARAQLASSPFAATWTSNLYFTFTAIDYFDELSGRDLFLHTWSLGVEEQFYLIWPSVLLALFWLGRAQRRAGKNGSGHMLAGLGIAFIASLALSLYWTKHMPQAAFYLMPSRIWQLSLGGLVALMLRDNASYRYMLTQGCSMLATYFMLGAGLALIIGSAIVLHPNLAYPGFWALAPAFGAALVIAAGHTLSDDRKNPLTHPVLVWIGDRSYSLYLWHWPIFILGFSLGFKDQTLPTLSMMLLTMVAAILSFQLIELPYWKGQWSHARPSRVISISLFVMGTMVAATFYSLQQLPQPGSNSVQSNKWRMDVPVIYRMKCDAWYAHAKVEPCFIGDDSAQKTVVLLGDSVGAQWYSIIPEIFRKPQWRIIVLTKSSCPMVDENYFYPRIRKIYRVCTDWRNAVLDGLVTLKPDVIIMGSTSTYGFSEAEWIEGSSRIFERASKVATDVFVIAGTPTLGFNGPGCVSRNLSPNGFIGPTTCQALNRLKRMRSVSEYLGKAASRFSNVHLLDLNDLVCPGGVCNAINEKGMIVYRDNQHLTDTFVRAQIPHIRQRINRIYEKQGYPATDALKPQPDPDNKQAP